MMRVYTCTDHAGHWVGVASVVVAPDEMKARELLEAELQRQGLGPQPFTLQEISTTTPQALVLQNGDY